MLSEEGNVEEQCRSLQDCATNQSKIRGGGEELLKYGCILKIWPTRLADVLDFKWTLVTMEPEIKEIIKCNRLLHSHLLWYIDLGHEP